MSRYIKSAETLKARVGKQVKVNGEIFDVTVHTDTISFDNEKNSFSIVNSPVCIERFLCKNRVASAGYKFKHTSSSKFILNKECRVTLKPYVGNFDDHSSCHTVVGMLLFCKDRLGDRGYMLLTNDEHLRGDPADDMKGYDWSWWLGYDEGDLKADVESTEPLESECHYVTQSGTEKTECNCVTQSGTEKTECNCVTQSGTEEKSYRLKKTGDDAWYIVRGALYYDSVRDATYLLSNDSVVDGAHPDVCERSDTGYEYAWWVKDGKDITGNMYKLEEYVEESKCDEGRCESGSCSGDPLVRIAEALERIAKALEK